VAGVLPVLLANVPPVGLADQTAAVAPPPKEPPKAAVVPPWHIAATADVLAVGFGFTVSVLLAVVVPHEPPLVVSVKVTLDAEEDDAV
jgi:hypothetical protein